MIGTDSISPATCDILVEKQTDRTHVVRNVGALSSLTSLVHATVPADFAHMTRKLNKSEYRGWYLLDKPRFDVPSSISLGLTSHPYAGVIAAKHLARGRSGGTLPFTLGFNRVDGERNRSSRTHKQHSPSEWPVWFSFSRRLLLRKSCKERLHAVHASVHTSQSMHLLFCAATGRSPWLRGSARQSTTSGPGLGSA